MGRIEPLQDLTSCVVRLLFHHLIQLEEEEEEGGRRGGREGGRGGREGREREERRDAKGQGRKGRVRVCRWEGVWRGTTYHFPLLFLQSTQLVV